VLPASGSSRLERIAQYALTLRELRLLAADPLALRTQRVLGAFAHTNVRVDLRAVYGIVHPAPAVNLLPVPALRRHVSPWRLLTVASDDRVSASNRV